MELLRELSEARGVSGNEQKVRDLLNNALQNRADRLLIDSLGNLLAINSPVSDDSASSLRVMVAAHMDEVGLIVTRIESTGLLRFAPVGGIDASVLLSKTVLIGDEGIPGVIGVKPIHLLKPDERTAVPSVESLYLDIGVLSKEAAEKVVRVGDYASFGAEYVEAGPTIMGKAMDDRVGCAILALLLRARYRFTLCGVFTAQEEVGARGARVAAYRLNPDIAFVIEGTVCNDLPSKKDRSPTSVLGQGPAITVIDKSVVASARLLDLLRGVAKDRGIPFQVKQPLVGGTDAGSIHRVREGVPCAVIAVPCRYIHSPVGVVSRADVDNALALMQAVLGRISEDAALAEDLRLHARSAPPTEAS